MMTRESEEAVLDFCARQYQEFHEQAWREQRLLEKSEMAAVALFLAGVEWFGHRAALLRIADFFQKGCAGHFSDLARKVEFDCSRFSSMLRRRLSTSAHA